MGVERARSAMVVAGRVVNEVVSFLVFSVLDVLDFLLCLVYKVIDYVKEAEWKPCYCSSAKDMIVVSETGGGSKIVRLCSSRLQLEDISDTLYSRPSLVADVSRSTVRELQRIREERRRAVARTAAVQAARSGASSTFKINPTIVEMLEGKIFGQQTHAVPRWSDCDCKVCNCWNLPPASRNSLFVRTEFPKDGGEAKENVLFIHGFISSSAFWTETVFPNLSEETKKSYRLFAIDLLGFGRSPKPADSLYTLREHIDMIERSVLHPYDVNSFHIVAHSLGSILALALACKYPGSVKSLTLLAPPFFPVPKGEQGTQYVLRRVAPRRVWPAIAFGASVACWYEHISRTICLLICKNHRLWEFLFKLVTRNKMRTFLMEGFWCHTHNAAWHTLHNIICGTGGRVEGYLDAIRDQLRCDVTIFHGTKDELLPIECSIALKNRVPRAQLKLIPGKDHITIVVGRQKAFARDLERIWNSNNSRYYKLDDHEQTN